MSKIVFISGATSGIGKATSLRLAELGYNLIIVGRRTDRLATLKTELETRFSVDVLCITLDVRNKKQVIETLSAIPDNWKMVDILINNAGLAAGLSPIDKGEFDDWDQMVDTNIKGLLYISRQIIPQMVARKTGHIVNISSIAGKETYENGNVYCATKHAVDSLSKAMRIDLLKYGIKVTNIAPGMVDTEFSTVRFKGDTERAAKVYENLTPLFAEDVADAIVYALTRPAHVNINDMLIMPTAQANSIHTHRQ